ncbi:MAG TPA: TIGR03000 domain-containing protein [Gemmataceae bacterium]|nr:TIGR03000 domain-containing protein [Gemmataceae bacterium]
MYSVVLMAALTAGSAAPDCHRCGCCGYCGGCYGGCWGGCYGCGGCYGGCYGGFGGCYGCGGCWGGCGGCGGCYGCWGGYSSWGCCGCMGGYGGYGYGGISYPGAIGGGMYAPGTAVPGTGAPTGEQLPPAKENKEKKEQGSLSSTKAKLVVELPANAKLFIDDRPIKAAPGVRTFNTPALEPGQAYYYMVRVETMRDGKPVSDTRRVIVRAGQIARADFKDLDSEPVRTAQAK